MRRRRSGVVTQHANDVRVVILGKKGVGKSALTVRFMTKRFIGEYDSSRDETWKHMTMVDDEHVPLEIKDITGECSKEKLDLCVGVGDIFIIMYSITDEASFEYAKFVGELVQERKREDMDNTVLVGTKKDLEHLRCVKHSSGKETANELQCPFHEISIRDGYEQVDQLFQELLRRYLKKSSSQKPLVKSILKKKSRNKEHFGKTALGRKKSVHQNAVPIVE